MQYSYEDTREIKTLIVGRAITGLSAFVSPMSDGGSRRRARANQFTPR